MIPRAEFSYRHLYFCLFMPSSLLISPSFKTLSRNFCNDSLSILFDDSLYIIMSNSGSITHVTYPLTTRYSRPTWCDDLLFTYFTSINGASTYWRDEGGPGSGTRSACYPTQFLFQHEPTVSGEYSPGVCPSGYKPASSESGAGAITSYCCPPYVLTSNLYFGMRFSTKTFSAAAVASLSKAKAAAVSLRLQHQR